MRLPSLEVVSVTSLCNFCFPSASDVFLYRPKSLTSNLKTSLGHSLPVLSMCHPVAIIDVVSIYCHINQCNANMVIKS